MSFGLTPMSGERPPDERSIVLAQNLLDFSRSEEGAQEVLPRFDPPLANRIDKEQIRCRRCKRSVKMTEQTGLNAGRRIICCAFYCHGEKGMIKICEDQLSPNMYFHVFEGQPELGTPPAQIEPPALPEKKASGPVDIDIEAEVIPIQTKALT